MLYTSGQLGLKPKTGELPEGIKEQPKQALENVSAILEKAGYTKEDVIKTTVYITNMDDFVTVNSIYGDFLRKTSQLDPVWRYRSCQKEDW